MNRVETAVSCFKEGFSCSQAVFSAYSELFGLNRELALKISQSFGGGIAHMGEMCGAVTGAFLVIGLKYGRIEAEDIEAKEKTYELVQEFVKRFKSLHGSVNCTELLGFDLGTPEGMKLAEKKELFENACPKFVQNAAEILEQIL
ncbi:MAG: C_GCAxxG_C_C family protein [Candidatus Aminicenantes bacterium]|nr:MAG: C_GCAxxG_C_C family protein [Candidatus Aminicenantes bacterium]